MVSFIINVQKYCFIFIYKTFTNNLSFILIGDSGIVYGFNQSDAKYVVTSEDLLGKINKLSDKFEHLKNIVYIRNGKTNNPEELVGKLTEKYQILPFDQVEANGAKIAPYEFALPQPNDIALIMYTSG